MKPILKPWAERFFCCHFSLKWQQKWWPSDRMQDFRHFLGSFTFPTRKLHLYFNQCHNYTETWKPETVKSRRYLATSSNCWRCEVARHEWLKRLPMRVKNTVDWPYWLYDLIVNAMGYLGNKKMTSTRSFYLSVKLVRYSIKKKM